MNKLKGTVQHYDWGGTEFIPALLGISNPAKKPFAEYWLGAHPSAPSQVVKNDGQEEGLDTFIAVDPTKILGKKIADQFGSLPYLMKVLDVRNMLSIQVHPTKPEAEKGFARENEAGIDSAAPNRNYKDENHKPEVMVALSDFWLLHGFRPHAAMLEILDRVGELNALTPVFENRGYAGLYKYIMELPQAGVEKLLYPLSQRTISMYQAGKLNKDNPDFWAARAMESGNMSDRGIFSIYFFNLLHLHPGEVIFQDAGIPHAYLEGQNVELMANSDNVLRGGLTKKHVDVPELLKHTIFEGIFPAILGTGEDKEFSEFTFPVPDFNISRYLATKSLTVTVNSKTVEIILVMGGSASAKNGMQSLNLKKGESIVLIAGEEIELQLEPGCLLFRASAPA
jgi:mannose-6-phosphate isomerase